MLLFKNFMDFQHGLLFSSSGFIFHLNIIYYYIFLAKIYESMRNAVPCCNPSVRNAETLVGPSL